MWKLENKVTGKIDAWFEKEFVNKIRKIALKECLTCGECKSGFEFEQCGYNDILELIEQEWER